MEARFGLYDTVPGFIAACCCISTGFRFSREEPLALVQNSGGPCAVLAPVQVSMGLWMRLKAVQHLVVCAIQAFIIQKRLFEDFHCDNLETKDWRSCAGECCHMIVM